MGYIIGGKFRRYGDSLMSEAAAKEALRIPMVKGSTGISIGRVQDTIARTKLAQSADISRTAPTFNDPRYTFTTLSIPTDQRTLNGLYRFFDDTDPVVGNAIRLHAEFPLSRISLRDCGDPVIQRHFEDMCDRINLPKLLFEIAIEYWRLGNCFPFGAWNADDYMWEQFVILNPDYVTVEGTYLNQKPFIRLQPDEHLKRIVSTGQPRELYDQLPPQIKKYVRLGQEIPLSPNNVFHLAHNKAPYENIGRSIIKRILKTLIYEDRMSMANFAIATRQVIPITIVKIGDPQSVEEDHFVNFLDKNELKVMTFKQMWETYSGPTSFNDGFKEVKDITQHELRTLSQNGDGTQSWNIIEGILRHPTPDKVVEVTTPHSVTRSTEAHGYMWVNPITLKYEHVTPQQLRERKNPTVVTMDHFNYKVNSQSVFGIPLTTDLSYLLGLWTADGSFCGHKNKTTTVVSDTKIRISNLDEGIVNYLTSTYHEKSYIGKKDTSIDIHVPLARGLKDYYNVPHTNGRWTKTGMEKIPQEVIFNSDLNIVGAFLAGVIDGDGYITKSFLNIGVACGSSREFMHVISLCLLSQGIQSHITFRANAWEVIVTGKKDINNLLNLVTPYLQHSKKKVSAKEFLEVLKTKLEHQDKSYVYDLDQTRVDEMFKDSLWRKTSGDHPLTYIKTHKRVNRNLISVAAKECRTKEVCETLCCEAVTSIKEKDKNSEYVYDLMLNKNSSHCYLVGAKGWLDIGNSGWVPEQTEIEDVKEMFAGREVDPNFTLFYHWGIDVQFYGASGKVMNLAAEFARTLKWKMIGLGISEAILSGGANYASAYAQLEVLRQRYLHFQLMLERFIHKGLFEPVARTCGFYKTNKTSRFGRESERLSAELKNIIPELDNPDYVKFARHVKKLAMDNELSKNYKYIYPRMDWDLMSLSNDIQYRNFLMSFDKMFPGERKVSEETFYKAANLDRDAEQTKIKHEYEQRLREDLKKAELTKEYLKKFQGKNLTPPNYVATQGAMDVSGMGALPSAIPGLPGPGGGAGPGGTPITPNAPVGAPAAAGAAIPGAPKTPTPAGTPAQAKQESIQIQQGMTAATERMEKEAEIMQQENAAEATGLKLENDKMLKERTEESEF